MTKSRGTAARKDLCSSKLATSTYKSIIITGMQQWSATNTDINLQSGQFSATAIASLWLLYFRSCWIVFNHTVQAKDVPLVSSSCCPRVTLLRSSWLLLHLAFSHLKVTHKNKIMNEKNHKKEKKRKLNTKKDSINNKYKTHQCLDYAPSV